MHLKNKKITDEVAKQTDWAPLLPKFVAEGSKLVQTSTNRMEFFLKKSTKLFYIIVSIIGGCITLGIVISHLIQQEFVFHSGKLGLLIVGLIMMIAGLLIVIKGSEPNGTVMFK